MARAFDVIGAGINGASTAYHLKAPGVERVLLMERATPAAGGTGRISSPATLNRSGNGTSSFRIILRRRRGAWPTPVNGAGARVIDFGQSRAGPPARSGAA